MARVNLTDVKVRSLKADPKAPDGRYEIMDAQVPGFGVRVSEKGLRTFILKSRMPGGRGPVRRRVGEYPAMTLEQARAKAGHWRTLIRQGTDPAVAEERERRTNVLRGQNTVAAVAEDWFREKVRSERKGAEVERDFRRHFLSRWGDRPVADVSRRDVRDVVLGVKAKAPAHARNLLGYAKRFFAWIVDQEIYGLEASPAESLSAARLIGERASKDRVLTDAEIFAVWRAAGRLDNPTLRADGAYRRGPGAYPAYPYGAVYRLLILTALRLNEVADAKWPEFDLRSRLWTIPAERMKGRNGKARAHVVPLTDEMMRIIESVPRFDSGDHLFSTSFGKKPVWMSDKIKKALDEQILLTLRALARKEGRDPRKVELPPWTNHDIRRTVRSNLSKLRIADEVAEAVLGHARPGVKGTYDRHKYLEEKREALGAWANSLAAITSGKPSNVVPLQARAIARP